MEQVRSIRLYSTCKLVKGDHPRSWASVFAWAIHQRRVAVDAGTSSSSA
jgi:hypothetical protein